MTKGARSRRVSRGAAALAAGVAALVASCAAAVVAACASTSPSPSAAPSERPLRELVVPEAGIRWTLPSHWPRDWVAAELLAGSEAAAVEPGASWVLDFQYLTLEGMDASLVRLAVFERAAWEASAPPAGPRGELLAELAETTTRAFVARLPGANPYPPGSPDHADYASLLLTLAQLEESFHVQDRPEEEPGHGLLAGTVRTEETMALLPTDVLVLALVEDQPGGRPALLLAERQVLAPGQPPMAFELAYRSDRIDPGRRYRLVARILRQGMLLFVADAGSPVLTQGSPDRVEILLQRARDTG